MSEIIQLADPQSDFRLLTNFLFKLIQNGVHLSGKDLLPVLLPSVSPQPRNQSLELNASFTFDNSPRDMWPLFGDQYPLITSERYSEKWTFTTDSLTLTLNIDQLRVTREGNIDYIQTNIPEYYFLHESLILKQDATQYTPVLYLHPNAQCGYGGGFSANSLLKVIKGYFCQKYYLSSYALYLVASGRKLENDYWSHWMGIHKIRHSIAEYRDEDCLPGVELCRKELREQLLPAILKYNKNGWTLLEYNCRIIDPVEALNIFEKTLELAPIKEESESEIRKLLMFCDTCSERFSESEPTLLLGQKLVHHKCILESTHEFRLQKYIVWPEIEFLKEASPHFLSHLSFELPTQPDYWWWKYENLLKTWVFEAEIFRGNHIYGGYLRRYLSSKYGKELEAVRDGDVDIHLPYTEYAKARNIFEQMSKLIEKRKMKFDSKGLSEGSRVKGFTLTYQKGYNCKLTLDVHPSNNHLNDPLQEKDGKLLFDAYPNVLTYRLDEKGKEELSVFRGKISRENLNYLNVFILALSSIYHKNYLLNEPIPKGSYYKDKNHERLQTKPREMKAQGWTVDKTFV